MAFAYHAGLDEKKRTEALRNLAARLSYAFFAKAEIDSVYGSNSILFAKGKPWRIFNLMQTTIKNLKITIFDYEYTQMYGRGERTVGQTVISFSLNTSNLPKFSLQPKTWLEGSISWLEPPGFNFINHPFFSTNYMLYGQDEQAVRRIFNQEIIKFYEKQTGLSTEIASEHMLFYYAGQRAHSQNLLDFLNIALDAFLLFQSSVPEKF